MDFDFDLAKLSLRVPGQGVHSDPVVADLSKPPTVTAADLNGRAVGPQAGDTLQRAGPHVGADQISDLRRNRVAWTVKHDLAAADS